MTSQHPYLVPLLQIFLRFSQICSRSPCLAVLSGHNRKPSLLVHSTKTGSEHDPENIRSISHTPVLSRLWRRLFKKRLVKFLTAHHLINPSQHMFLKSWSCLACKFHFVNLVNQGANFQRPMLIILLEMSKAFECISYSRVLAKIVKYGVRNQLSSWQSSEDSDRFQVVGISGCYC